MASNPNHSNRLHERDAAKVVATNVRDRRIALGLSVEALASQIGVTYQQAYKYERGTNRITIDGLVRIASALGCSPSDLLIGLGEEPAADLKPHATAAAVAHIRAFHALPENVKPVVSQLVRALSLPSAA